MSSIIQNLPVYFLTVARKFYFPDYKSRLKFVLWGKESGTPSTTE